MDSDLYDLKECEYGLRMDELSVKCLLYADDQVILSPSASELQEMVSKMNDSVKKKVMKVNFGKTKMMVFEVGESTTECDIRIEGEKVEQVEVFVNWVVYFHIERILNSTCNRKTGPQGEGSSSILYILISKLRLRQLLNCLGGSASQHHYNVTNENGTRALNRCPPPYPRPGPQNAKGNRKWAH
ncbi:hypothetical protein EVAR_30967_1 [Eumeta japonica]|uniref:Reverse transcriptase domain-containing protein n=1 Tax=Eumeta variegata TaxID=151549 RepID=A0A4C1W9X2_EUMVA|nr:hypothetical protein EVAR_30967_1 [Eumeta japonica]